MLRRNFIWGRDDEGTLGWLPTNMPRHIATAARGFTVAHDAMEHSLRDRGTWADEIMASGAALLVRGISSYYSLIGEYAKTPAGWIAEDIADFVIQGLRLPDPGPTRPLRNAAAEAMLHEALRFAREQALSEIHCRDDADAAELEGRLPLTLARCVGWMRKGYRRAVRRYDGDGHAGLLASAFLDISKKTGKATRDASEGDVLKIAVRPDGLDQTVHLYRPALWETTEY